MWIPRYKYKIFNEENYVGATTVQDRAQTIEIAFDSNGMWVGKFETGYKGATLTAEAQINSNDSSKIQIKPNVYSWTFINVSNAHLASFHYQRSLDSHMMKNTEWGAVAYLQHSIYGSQASVRTNNNGYYVTGFSSVMEPTCVWPVHDYFDSCNISENLGPYQDGLYSINYLNSQSMEASTTGNYSGIYDMSGGVVEYVMGVLVYPDGTAYTGPNSNDNSGFNGFYSVSGGIKNDGIVFPEEKYYDKYSWGTNDQDYSRRILGDATGEMGPFQVRVPGIGNVVSSSWYEDYGTFIDINRPWFVRGGGFGWTGGVYTSMGQSSGMFSFYTYLGFPQTIGYRVVLSF